MQPEPEAVPSAGGLHGRHCCSHCAPDPQSTPSHESGGGVLVSAAHWLNSPYGAPVVSSSTPSMIETQSSCCAHVYASSCVQSPPSMGVSGAISQHATNTTGLPLLSVMSGAAMSSL